MHSMSLFSASLTAVSVSSLQFSVLWNYVGKINFSGLFQTDNCNRDKAEYSNGKRKPPRKIGKKHNVKKLGLQIVKLVIGVVIGESITKFRDNFLLEICRKHEQATKSRLNASQIVSTLQFPTRKYRVQ